MHPKAQFTGNTVAGLFYIIHAIWVTKIIYFYKAEINNTILKQSWPSAKPAAIRPQSLLRDQSRQRQLDSVQTQQTWSDIYSALYFHQHLLLLLLLLLLWRAHQARPIWGDEDVPKRWGIPPDSESGGIRLSLVVVDSHLLTGAPLKGSCRCPQLTYCQLL